MFVRHSPPFLFLIIIYDYIGAVAKVQTELLANTDDRRNILLNSYRQQSGEVGFQQMNLPNFNEERCAYWGIVKAEAPRRIFEGYFNSFFESTMCRIFQPNLRLSLSPP